MPTATTTTTAIASAQDMSNDHGVLALKARLRPSAPVSPDGSDASLRSLYNRAAKAFIHRDFLTTFNLVSAAFSSLTAPQDASPDGLDTQRRKWDILRITLDTTVYHSPVDKDTLPRTLRANLLLSSHAFIATLHTRSLDLFTPSSMQHHPRSSFLPHQVLITLVASSLKIDTPDFGRGIVEEWLSHRVHNETRPGDTEGYEKVLEMYCLHVLPRMEDWDYAKRFLDYESELPYERKQNLRVSLEGLHAQARAALLQKQQAKPSPITPPPRSPSPASSTSSLSTTSTRTAVPTNHRAGPSHIEDIPSIPSSPSSASLKSDATVTRRSSRQRQLQKSSASQGSRNGSAIHASRLPRAPPIDVPLVPTAPPSTYALLKAYVKRYLATHKFATLSLVFMLLPLLALALRIRRRSTALLASSPPPSAAMQVRRRLQDAKGDSLPLRLWRETVRAVTDTVRMGGGGLV